MGCNSRLDEIQAAILRTKLPHLDAWNKRRRSLAARYSTGLQGSDTALGAVLRSLKMPLIPSDVEHVFHLYVVRTPLRDRLRDYLVGAGVSTGIHYPKGAHLQPAFAHLGYEPGSCLNAEAATAEILSLPIFPQLSGQEVSQIVRLIRFFFAMR